MEIGEEHLSVDIYEYFINQNGIPSFGLFMKITNVIHHIAFLVNFFTKYEIQAVFTTELWSGTI